MVEETNTSIEHVENEEDVEMISENETDMDSQASISAVSQSSTKIYKIYRCSTCGLYSNSNYNFHQHITDANVLDYKTCQLCNFIFTPKSLQYHMKHHEKPDYTIDNIQVVEFDGKTLLGEGTSTKNSDAVDDTDMSVTGSIDSNELEKSDYILFKCMQCDVCVRTMCGAYKHTFYTSHMKIDAKECPHCNYKFNASNLTGHEKMHTKLYREPKAGMPISGEVHFSDIKAEVGLNKIPRKSASDKYTLYKCVQCELCMHNKKSAIKHSASNLHLADLKVEIIEFGEEPELEKSVNRKRKHDGHTDEDLPELVEKEARLFKCSCGLHFLNENSVEKHLRVCGKDDTITKQSCSKCGLKFTTESLFSHLCTHHGNVKYKYKYEIVEMPPSLATELIVLYKCSKCDTHFLACNGAKKHLSSCRGPESRKISRECDKCGLYFHFKLLMEHRMYHHILTKSIVNYEYKIVNVSDSTDESDTENNKLYKCLACAIHFLKKPSIEEHLKIPHRTKMDINTLDCEVCSLTFTLRTLIGHKKIHHEKYNVDEFEIHEYDSNSKMEVAMKRHPINAVPENTITVALNKCSEEDINASNIDDSLEDTNAEVSSATREKKKEVSNILYKCSECNVHYLKESTVYKHTIKNHQRIHPSDIFECKHCGLNFRALTLTPHTRQHHYDNNFKLKDFIIHEYEPLTRETILKNKKSTPRIIIYNAADGEKNVDSCEKVDKSNEEGRECVPANGIKNCGDPNKTIEQANSNDQKPIDIAEVNKVSSTMTNENEDVSFSNCMGGKHKSKHNDLGKSVTEVETHASEKSIRNFIIFES
ncbi:Zinc finger protein 555 [Eumeta japonica]|uniref:Zinc finger protein 555 n=1 Tax=Eumeta variegata TaxID=151549 RepID=A0A4C1TCX6_EUMVA|nr:Zinc finger protein 555 [Eumeta japonica]